jgi:hypothetical protein
MMGYTSRTIFPAVLAGILEIVRLLLGWKIRGGAISRWSLVHSRRVVEWLAV